MDPNAKGSKKQEHETWRQPLTVQYLVRLQIKNASFPCSIDGLVSRAEIS
jgi:hypothetical protein